MQGTLPPAHGKRLQLQKLALKPEVGSPAGTATVTERGPVATTAGQQPQGVNKERLAAAAQAAEAGAVQQHWAVKKEQSAAAPAAGQQPVAVKDGWPPAAAAAAQPVPATRQPRLWEQKQRSAADTSGNQPRAVREAQMPPRAWQRSPVDKQKGREMTVDGVRRHLCVHLRQGDFWHRIWEESVAGKQVSMVLQGGRCRTLESPLEVASQADRSADCSRGEWCGSGFQVLRGHCSAVRHAPASEAADG